MFYIIDAGARIQTPLDKLLHSREVAAVNATSPVRAIEEEGEGATRTLQAALERAYHESDQPETRHPIKFAREIMSSPVVTGQTDQTLFEIWRIFAEHRIHHLPLLDQGRHLRGIVSDRDIMRFAANSNRGITHASIGELMTHQVITAAPETEVRDLAEVMVRRGIGAIPVIDAAGDLQGIVSRTDILRTLVHRAPLEIWS